MVNRVLAAKALKRLKQIRRLPKPMPDTQPQLYLDNKVRPIPAAYSAENVRAPRQPNRELMQGYKHRGASLGREDVPGKFIGVPPERKAVVDHLERMKTLYEAELSFTLLNTRVHRARVFFNAQRTAYVLLFEQFKDGCVRSSFPHSDKKELVDKFRRKCLTWVEYSPRVSSV